jgi:hypothetical protein
MDPVGAYFDQLIHFQLEGLTLMFTVMFFACLYSLIAVLIRFQIWKWILRIEGREFHKGWKAADDV